MVKQSSIYLSQTVWTNKDDDFLRTYYVQLSQREMAIRLARTKREIQTRLKKLGLVLSDEQKLLKKQGAAYKMLDRREGMYTEKEVDFLRETYANMPNMDIATHLNRTISGITKKAF